MRIRRRDARVARCLKATRIHPLVLSALRTSILMSMQTITKNHFSAFTDKVITQAREHKLSLNHILTIIILRDLPPMVATNEIASKIKVTNGSMTGISDELVRRGLIIREHNQLDRRKIMLSLTQRGKVVADCILDQP